MISLSDEKPDTTTLDPNGGYLTFINTFTVEPGKGETLLEALRTSTEEIFRHRPGFLSANLHLSRDGRRVLNYAQWRSKEDYTAATTAPEVQAHMKQAAALALSFDPVDYDLRHVMIAG